MAKMTLADLVSHQEFMEYFNLRMVETSPLIRSGIVSQDPAIAAKCANAGFEGKTVDMPFLNSLDEADDAEVPVEDTAPTGTDKVTAGQDTAVVQFRRKKFGITDVTRILGGVDPARQIIDQMTPYWHKQDQKRLLAILKGIFAANARAYAPGVTYSSGTATLAANKTVTATGMYGAASLSSGDTVYENGNNGDMILDITGENGNAALLDKNTLMLAAQLLGDHKADLTAIACNSMVDTYLSGIDTNAGLYRASDGPATLAKYNGRDIIVDDTIPYDASTKVATIYLFGKGSVAYNPLPTLHPFEAQRDADKGTDYIHMWRRNIIHIRGCKWIGTMSGLAPTDAELYNAGSWKRVYDKKRVPCVMLKCKLG